MCEQMLREALSLVLNDENGVIPDRADLPFMWRNIPAEDPDSTYPAYPARFILLASYINWSHTKLWAREGLRTLLRELLENHEPVPDLLSMWALHQYAKGNPSPRRGRPEEVNRNFRFWVVFNLLQRRKYSREAAFNLIAELMNYDTETIRSIIRKCEVDHPFR